MILPSNYVLTTVMMEIRGLRKWIGELSHPIYDNQALLLDAEDSDTVTFS